MGNEVFASCKSYEVIRIVPTTQAFWNNVMHFKVFM